MEQIFQVVGYNGPYQTYLFIINLLRSILPCVYSIQVAFMTKHPSFIVKILQGENAGNIIEMNFDEKLCNSSLYEITKDPLKSVNKAKHIAKRALICPPKNVVIIKCIGPIAHNKFKWNINDISIEIFMTFFLPYLSGKGNKNNVPIILPKKGKDDRITL